ncbi:hypothetical protein [Plastoroseomonas arctica]|uniref:Uncharacterized protein n=1 Tax=Plastoroseomonas arctica TaxID=1509237 RepID=A0AAF1K026_9PROT|nr:hypothetical protein [Plastoroseomonas arctica]MBR0657400.1 hypothetical protein [Plastoroseomonas arctica]
MQLTILGAALIPLALWGAGNADWLIRLALVAGIFEAGAALVIGGSPGFGLPTAMVPGLLLLAHIVIQYAAGMRYAGEGIVLKTSLPLIGFMAFAVVTAVLLPDIYAGRMLIWPNRPDPVFPAAVPLAFNSGNVTQSLYLAMNVAMAVGAGLILTGRGVRWRSLLNAYLLSGYLVVGLCLWDFAARIAGVWFPADELRSNPSWAIVAQSLGPVPRIQGPFAEPAALAFFLAGLAFCCLSLCMKGHATMRPQLLLMLSILCMLLSTSTTGIMILMFGLPLVLMMGGGDRRARMRIQRTLVSMVLAGGIVLVPLVLALPSLVDAAAVVLESTLEKGDSSSFEDRMEMDRLAVDAMMQSYGIGVGWGSTRSSSFIPGILGNSGIVGLGLLVWFGVALSGLIRRAGRIGAPEHAARPALDGFTAAVCGQLCAALLSSPTISSLSFFLHLAIVLGAAGRMIVDAAPARRLSAAALHGHADALR